MFPSRATSEPRHQLASWQPTAMARQIFVTMHRQNHEILKAIE